MTPGVVRLAGINISQLAHDRLSNEPNGEWTMFLDSAAGPSSSEPPMTEFPAYYSDRGNFQNLVQYNDTYLT